MSHFPSSRIFGFLGINALILILSWIFCYDPANLILSITAVLLFWYTEETQIIRRQSELQTEILKTQIHIQTQEREESSKIFLVWAGRSGSAGFKLRNEGAPVSGVKVTIGSDEKRVPKLISGEEISLTAPGDQKEQFFFKVIYTDKTATRWVDTYQFNPSIGVTRTQSKKGTSQTISEAGVQGTAH